MRDVSIRVMNMVRRTLVENPGISNEALYAAAVALDPSVAKLTLRQFHARYPLQVRRWELGGPSLRMRKPLYQPGSDRMSNGEPADGAAAPESAAEATAEPPASPRLHDPSTPWPMEVWPEAASVRPAPEPRRKKPAAESQPADASVAAAPSGAGAAGPAPDRDGVRSALLRFAAEIAAVETAAEMANALRTIDEHVGRVLACAGA